MGEWIIDFGDEAIGDLARLPHVIREGVLAKLEWLRMHFSQLQLQLQLQPLGGEWRGFYKLRVGDYRAIYDIRWSSCRLIVVVVKHRSHVYRRRRK